MMKDIGAGEEVIGIEEAHHVTSRHRQSLIHCVIQTPILFTDPFEAAAELRLKATYDIQSAITAATVNNNVLQILAALIQDTLKSVSYCGCGIQTDCDYSDSHKDLNMGSAS